MQSYTARAAHLSQGLLKLSQLRSGAVALRLRCAGRCCLRRCLRHQRLRLAGQCLSLR
jgi:hypothetical protein